MASGFRNDFRRKLKVSEPKISVNDFYPLRMTVDRKTEMYVKFAKVMIIFQGPVTDKRRQAVAELTSKFKYSCRLISDETYTKETLCQFSEEKIDNFYNYFQSRAKKACEDGFNLIVIDPSMTNPFLIKYFFYLAQKMQYVILPYPPLVKEHANDCKTYRNTQAEKFQKAAGVRINQPNLFKHLFCGWFLHDIDSTELREEASLYIQDCFDNIFDFQDLFNKIWKFQEFKSYYNMENKRQDLAFCTVKINEGFFEFKEYSESEEFMKHYGSMSKLYVVGFVISPHIVAARIRLTFDQRKLWDMPDDLDEQCEITKFPSELLKQSKVDLPDENITLISSKSNRTLITGDTIHNPTEVIDFRARGRSCHILLGRANNAPLRNVNYDVPLAVSREKHAVQNYPDVRPGDVTPYELDRCSVRRIGKYWLVYLRETVIVNGLFTSACATES